jgi:hypothetical protein
MGLGAYNHQRFEALCGDNWDHDELSFNENGRNWVKSIENPGYVSG